MIESPEDYACHLAGCAAATFSMMFAASTELRAAARALGAEKTRDVLIAAAKQEAANSYTDHVTAVGDEAKSWVDSGAVDRMFGCVVAYWRQTAEKAAQAATKED